MPKRKSKKDEPYQFQRPVPEAPMLNLGVRRTQVCGKHNTMKINGVCRRCLWESKPKRKCINPPEPSSSDKITRSSAGETTI